MTDERQFHETVERCVSIMAFYHQAQRSEEVTRWVAEAIRAVAHWLGGVNLEAIGAGRGIVPPVEDALIARFGHRDGPRLTTIFVDALKSAGPILGSN